MSRILQWYKFLRTTNLLIMVITFYLIKYLVLVPYAVQFDVELLFNDWNFLLLVIVTMLTASAGNIVNDIYDVDIDQINKPEKVFINRLISKKNAWRLFFTLNGLAMILIFIVYSNIDWFLIWMYPFGFFLTWSMLWLYSYRYKKSVIVGNLIVGVFVSFVPWSVCYPELVNTAVGTIPNSPVFMFTGIIYIVFAFVSTILREIIKDIEDMDGDAQFGGKTLPIVYGAKKAKRVGQFVGLLLIAIMTVSTYLLFNIELTISAIYGIVTVIIPTLYVLWALEQASDKKTFHQLSQISKLVMLAGLIFLIVLYLDFY